MKKLISSDEGTPAAKQITHPCSDCPWRRDALPGWLGGNTADDYLQAAHSDSPITCHVHANVQCAGAGVYRRNVCKMPRNENDVARMVKPDKKTVFASPVEFKEHHAD